MLHRHGWIRVGLGLVTLLAATAAAAASSLDQQIETLLNRSKLDPRLRLSITILDAQTGRTLGSHRPDAAMIPASNMKLLTSAVAADVLGPDFVFESHLLIQPGVDASPKRVIVQGSGDPAFADPELLQEMRLSVEDLLDTWVSALRSAGALDVEELVVDDRIFDRDFVHPTWPEAQLNRRYCAEVAGFNFHTNILSIYTTPTREGAAPTLRTEPDSPWISLNNRARSVGRNGNHTAWASRRHGSNDIGVHGDIRHASSPVPVTVHNIPEYFATLLAHRIRSAGGSVATVRTADMSDDFSDAIAIHTVRTPLSVVLERCNKDSSNLYAESLLKRIGHEITRTPGSWANGATVIRMNILERIGPEAASHIIVADGSGMSRQNRVTTGVIARWLHAVGADERIGRFFIDSLPTAGEGTLRARMRDRRSNNTIRAKSGYLSGVSALSGYVIDESTGRKVIFSVISNERPGNVALATVRNIEEEIILIADAWLTERTRATSSAR